MMKKVLFILITLAICLLLCPVSADTVPDLTGSWVSTNGTVILFTGEHQEMVKDADLWNITQKDRYITGTNSFYIGDELIVEFFTGVITPDGKAVYIVDENGGFYLASIDKEDVMTVTYLNTGDVRDKPGYGLAFGMTLQKQA